jgi:hypothetical protein
VGLEPTRYRYRRILSPLRLPIPPPPRDVVDFIIIFSRKNHIFDDYFNKNGGKLGE